MNILLTGAAGQLGSELTDLLSDHGRLIATDRFVPATASDNWVEMDICDSGRLEDLLNCLKPGLIVNTAAFTAVDLAESEPEIAFALNAELPARLAHWTENNDARLIHYSTDYVFDGSSSKPYTETDSPKPQNVYGDSKLAGEIAIEQSQCVHAILRTSWVYSSHGKNFLLSMLDLASRGLTLKVVDDQNGCPTWARNLAAASDSVIRKWAVSMAGFESGVYHYRDNKILSWYDFARTIFRLGVNAGLLEQEPEMYPVPSVEFPQPARRPERSVLDTQRIQNVFNIHPACFDHSVQTVINEIAAGGLNQEKT